VKRGTKHSFTKNQLQILGIFLKFDPPIYENDTSPFGKGGIEGDFSGG
jgi:hypothetical protein